MPCSSTGTGTRLAPARGGVRRCVAVRRGPRTRPAHPAPGEGAQRQVEPLGVAGADDDPLRVGGRAADPAQVPGEHLAQHRARRAGRRSRTRRRRRSRPPRAAPRASRPAGSSRGRARPGGSRPRAGRGRGRCSVRARARRGPPAGDPGADPPASSGSPRPGAGRSTRGPARGRRRARGRARARTAAARRPQPAGPDRLAQPALELGPQRLGRFRSSVSSSSGPKPDHSTGMEMDLTAGPLGPSVALAWNRSAEEAQ